jgi:hypothetical protein
MSAGTEKPPDGPGGDLSDLSVIGNTQYLADTEVNLSSLRPFA